MNAASAGYADLGNGRLYYGMRGEGETVVLSHAGFVDSRMWDDQWDAFAARYRAIRFDMRGFGKSDPAAEPVCRREDLRRLLENLGVERAAFVGCSLSDEVVIDYALEHPERVWALVVVSAAPGGFEMQGEMPPELMELFAAMQQGDLARASELQNRIWIDGPFRQPEQVSAPVRRRAAEMNRIALESQTMRIADAHPACPLDPPAAQRLSEIDAPTLLIAGALDNAEIVRAAEFMRAAIPNAEKIVMPDCAHLPNMEQPEAFNRHVLEFLDRRA